MTNYSCSAASITKMQHTKMAVKSMFLVILLQLRAALWCRLIKGHWLIFGNTAVHSNSLAKRFAKMHIGAKPIQGVGAQQLICSYRQLCQSVTRRYNNARAASRGVFYLNKNTICSLMRPKKSITFSHGRNLFEKEGTPKESVRLRLFEIYTPGVGSACSLSVPSQRCYY